jgi:hypothetical protein
MAAIVIAPSATEPDISVAVAEEIINEALAFLDEQRTGLVEILDCIHEDGGAHGYILAQFVAPYVSKESCLKLLRPFAQRVREAAKVT